MGNACLQDNFTKIYFSHSLLKLLFLIPVGREIALYAYKKSTKRAIASDEKAHFVNDMLSFQRDRPFTLRDRQRWEGEFSSSKKKTGMEAHTGFSFTFAHYAGRCAISSFWQASLLVQPNFRVRSGL
jgi:hypothetical protein